jgi:hypothetical protein
VGALVSVAVWAPLVVTSGISFSPAESLLRLFLNIVTPAA